MCGFCDWGDMTPFGEDDPVAAAERRRVSQNLWGQLMQEIEKADASPAFLSTED